MPIIAKAIIWHVFKKNIPIPKPLCVVLFGTRLLLRLTNLGVIVWAITSISTKPKNKQTHPMGFFIASCVEEDSLSELSLIIARVEPTMQE